MRRFLGALTVFTVAVALPLPARADGLLPPQPYRYLHPPPALASNNSPPESGSASIQVAGGHSKAGYLFTHDTQAGFILPAGALVTPSGVTSVRIHIDPVETPPSLPQHYAAEGNAYRVTATGEPGNQPVRLVRRANLTLRWPHPPLAIYTFAAGTWSQLCYSDNATFTTSTMSCPTSHLGIFTAVTNPALTGVTPSAPATSNRFGWLGRAIPAIVVLVVVVLVALVAFVTRRPRRKTGNP